MCVVELGNDKIEELIFTPDNINKFWECAKKFPTVYGHEVETFEGFVDLFFDRDYAGFLVPRGLFWVMNDFTGVFYLSNIREDHDEIVDGYAHYTFFDRKHHGRAPLVRKMLDFWFTKYGFQRLSAEIPNYTTPQARHFAQECGMAYEGKRRKAAFYKGEWFDVNLYGILRNEALNGRRS